MAKDSPHTGEKHMLSLGCALSRYQSHEPKGGKTPQDAGTESQAIPQ